MAKAGTKKAASTAKKGAASAAAEDGIETEAWIGTGYDDLRYSLIFIVLISLTAQVFRMLISTLVSNKKVRAILHEIVSTAEMCATCFELGIIAENYGVEYYGVFYFAASLWWSLTWTDSYSSPNNHLEDLVNGDSDGGDFLLMSTIEIITGCLAFKVFVKPLWALKWVKLHKKKLKAKSCAADLSVAPIYGGLIEGGGTMLFTVLSKVITKKLNGNIFASVLNSVLDTFLVVLAYDFSGGYFNPVLATSMQYGCKGATTMDHLIVYWFGGIFGTLVGLFVSTVFVPK